MKEFDPNWTTISEKHHLVPNTYLKGWQHKDSYVYYIDKNENNIDFANPDQSKNTRKIVRTSNFYSRRVGALFQSKLDCDKYFAPLRLHGYKVKIDGLEVSDSIRLNNSFLDEFDLWSVYDTNDNLISENEKQSLKEEIKSIHIRDLEEAWNQIFENTWFDVRNDILTEVNKNKKVNKIPAIRREELVGFMVSMEWRTEPAQPILKNMFNELIRLLGIEEFLNDPIPEEKKMYPFINTYGENYLHNILLSMYHQLFNKKGPIYEEIQYILNNMNLELFVPEIGYEFITTDNPVCRFQNDRDQTEYLFPISPDLACAVRKGSPVDKNHYFLNTLSKDEVFAYNEQLKKDCNKGYILGQPSKKPYFK